MLKKVRISFILDTQFNNKGVEQAIQEAIDNMIASIKKENGIHTVNSITVAISDIP